MNRRLEKLDVSGYGRLASDDECWYLGEYTAGGGFKASETNNQIFNLKKKPTVPAGQLHFKTQAIAYWSAQLRAVMNLAKFAANTTLVPAPGSKASGHPDYDDRMFKILQGLVPYQPDLDVRQLLIAAASREAQHEGSRASAADLEASMAVDYSQLAKPIKSVVIVVDDVFTQGGTFKAMQAHLMKIKGVKKVRGLFLARTVWPLAPGPNIDLAKLLANLKKS